MAETSPLVDGQDQNAGDVVQTARSLFLREVSDEMTTKVIILSHDVEEEWFHIIVKSFGA